MNLGFVENEPILKIIVQSQEWMIFIIFIRIKLLQCLSYILNYLLSQNVYYYVLNLYYPQSSNTTLTFLFLTQSKVCPFYHIHIYFTFWTSHLHHFLYQFLYIHLTDILQNLRSFTFHLYPSINSLNTFIKLSWTHGAVEKDIKVHKLSIGFFVLHGVVSVWSDTLKVVVFVVAFDDLFEDFSKTFNLSRTSKCFKQCLLIIFSGSFCFRQIDAMFFMHFGP